MRRRTRLKSFACKRASVWRIQKFQFDSILMCYYIFYVTTNKFLIGTSTTTDKTFPIEWTKVTMDNIYSMTSKLIIDGICSKQRTKTLERLFKNNSLIILNLIALTSFALFTYNYLLNQFFRIGSLGLCYLFS